MTRENLEVVGRVTQDTPRPDDDVLFFHSDDGDLRSWGLEHSPQPGMGPLWISAAYPQELSEFHVINDQLFFLATSEEGIALHRIEPDFPIQYIITESAVVDAYQDWFA